MGRMVVCGAETAVSAMISAAEPRSRRFSVRQHRPGIAARDGRPSQQEQSSSAREVAVSINGEALLWGALIFAMVALFAGAPILAKFYLRPPPQGPDEDRQA